MHYLVLEKNRLLIVVLVLEAIKSPLIIFKGPLTQFYIRTTCFQLKKQVFFSETIQAIQHILPGGPVVLLKFLEILKNTN